MALESGSELKALANNKLEEFSNFEKIEGLDDEGAYSFRGTSNAILGFVIAIGAIAIPILAVLNDRSVPQKEPTSLYLEPYGSKHSFPITIKRISQHSC